MKLYKYIFSDGSFVIAATIEEAVLAQRREGRSERVVKRERY